MNKPMLSSKICSRFKWIFYAILYYYY
jgi:hypothetical protein